jgi:hypothetical protein
VASTPPLSGPVESVRYLHTDYADTAQVAVTGGSQSILSVGSTAASFPGALTDYLATAATLRTGDVDCTVAGWAYRDSDSFQQVFTDNSAGTIGFRLYFSNATRLYMSVNGSLAGTAPASAPAGAWHFIVGYHDSSANLTGVSINGAAAVTAAHATGLGANAGPFRVGRHSAASDPFDGDAACAGVWNRVLTAAEITALYAGGKAMPYAALPSGLKSGLISYWNLDETTGTRYDSHGTNHLTMTGTVGQAAGPAALTASTIYRPRTLSQASTAGETDLTFFGTHPVPTKTVLSSEPVTVTISGGGNAKTGAWEITTGGEDHDARRPGS